MGFRDFIAGRQTVTAVCALILLLAAGIFAYRRMYGTPSGVSTKVWFYDLNTGRLFVGSINAIPPIPAPSGPRPDGSPAGVRAHVYTCTTCTEAERKMVYLESRTMESQQLLQATQRRREGAELTPEMLEAQQGKGVLVKRISDPEWRERQDPEVQRLMIDAVLQLCPGTPSPKPCAPEDR